MDPLTFFVMEKKQKKQGKSCLNFFYFDLKIATNKLDYRITNNLVL